MKTMLIYFVSALAGLLRGHSQEQKVKAAPPANPLAGLEKTVLYHPRPYGAAVIRKFEDSGGRRLNYSTSQGLQAAWLIPASRGAAPEKLWIVCAGNGSLALEMAGLSRAPALSRDAWLLVDYPGYGECKGEPCPASIRENVKASVLMAAKQLSIDPAALPQRACTFGHSLGCAAALLAVEEFRLRSAVLCAPFTSTAEVAHEKFRLPLDFPFEHKFDNRTGLKALANNKGRAWIFHGVADEVIPVTMSETLAKEFMDTVTLKIIPAGRHNDIFQRSAPDLAKAMEEARK